MESHKKTITEIVQSYIGMSLAILTLLGVLGGYIIYLKELEYKVTKIETNDLKHIQASLDRLEAQKEKDNERMTTIEKTISKIEGWLSR